MHAFIALPKLNSPKALMPMPGTRTGSARALHRTRGEEQEGEQSQEEAGEMEMARSWQELGVVDTIYEDDHEEEKEDEEEEDCFNSPSLSSSATTRSLSCSPPLSLSSLPTSLKNAVQEWSRANGCTPDVIIRFQEQCFPLHRDPITARSSYLKRQLLESSDITLVLPAGLMVETFTNIIAFCYSSDITLSPSNLAAVWAAADWLELTADNGLVRRTEDYFFQEVATDYDRAAEVLRSCTKFFEGEAAGAAASLLVRCLEVLAASGGADNAWLENVALLSVDEFQVVAEATQARFVHDHDLLYTILDQFLENHKGKLSEEEKNRLCYNVNCTKLSHHLFMHLVQNPRLPLRFVVQAMLVEQLHSHHSMLHRAVSSSAPPIPLKNTNPNNRSAIVPANEAAGDANITLGDILQRDAVLRQSAHIRTSMQATSFRIDSLERELSGLRRRLRCSEEALNATAAVDRASARSASFRIVRGWHWDGEDISDSRAGPGKGSTKDAKGFTAKLVHGLKSLFRRPGNGAPACGDNSLFGAGENGAVAEAPDVENKAVCQDEERRPGHRRNQSTA